MEEDRSNHSDIYWIGFMPMPKGVDDISTPFFINHCSKDL